MNVVRTLVGIDAFQVHDMANDMILVRDFRYRRAYPEPFGQRPAPCRSCCA